MVVDEIQHLASERRRIVPMVVGLVIELQHALGLGHGTDGTVRVANGELPPLERSVEECSCGISTIGVCVARAIFRQR